MHRKFIEHLGSFTTDDFIIKKGAKHCLNGMTENTEMPSEFGAPFFLLYVCVLYSNLMEFSDAVQHVLVSLD